MPYFFIVRYVETRVPEVASACSALVWAEMQGMQMKCKQAEETNKRLQEEGKQDLMQLVTYEFTNIPSLHKTRYMQTVFNIFQRHFVVNFNLFQER